MTVGEIASALGCSVLSGASLLGRQVTGGYASDLLSCAMAGCKAGDVWVTLQAHQNVVAVASLTDVACVIISESAAPDAATVARAEQEGVAMLGTPLDTFSVAARLARLGLEA